MKFSHLRPYLPPRSTWALLSLLNLITLGCQSGLDPAPETEEWTLHQTTEAVEAAQGMVVSGHPLASQAGVEALKAGGNAIDAAVAVGFALAVVLPEAGNIGGGGFLVYRGADGEVETLDYRETAPGGATRDMYLDEEGKLTEASLTGHLAVGVPGSVAGLWEMHQKRGTLPWADLVQPAIDLARGHEVDEVRAEHLAAAVDRLERFAASRQQFLAGDKAPMAGARWQQPELARTLDKIAAEGAEAFYRGSIADLIVEEMERGGGLINHEDLSSYQPVWRRPIEIDYRGYTVYSMPPPSSGGTTVGQILNILEGFDPLPPFGHASLVHLEVEAMRLAYSDRARHLGDPDFVQVPADRLLSQAYADSLREQIHPDRATSTPPFTEALQEGTQTTHYSIVDSQGQAAAVTTTLNSAYGSAVTVTGAGFLLNNEMDDFAAAPGQPNQFGLIQGEANAIAAGKRMLSSMAPTIVLDPRGELFLVVGTPGGSTIITSVYHVISNVIDHGMSLAEAVAAPRIHHQAWPDLVYWESRGLESSTRSQLERMGHELWERPALIGDIAAIQPGAVGWVGVADPRRGGGAAGY